VQRQVLKCKKQKNILFQTYLKYLFLIPVFMIMFLCCKDKLDPIPVMAPVVKEEQRKSEDHVVENTIATTILSRFSVPQGYIRQEIEDQSFASYLRNFPLLASDTPVHLYNGQLKGNQYVHAAVLDIDVGQRDLQQCADAIMRLRAEYQWSQKKYDEIAFNFTNGWRFDYSKWREGNKLFVGGNKTEWRTGNGRKESYKDFRAYLDQVFMYAGTLSLSKELKPKSLENLEIGDVFIYGGSPGHAVLVVDMAVNETTGDKAFLLAQSYMPAQQIHVLKNMENRDMSPWYLVSEIEHALYTPEWTFESNSLKEF
jgi:hypothetical protein